MYISDQERVGTPPSFDYDAFDLPENISLNFRLHPHLSKNDLPPQDELESEVRSADVVILESIHEEGGDAIFRKIVQGNAKEYQRIKGNLQRGNITYNGWLAHMMSALYDSRTPVTTIDVCADDRVVPDLRAANIATLRVVETATSDEELLATRGLLEVEYGVYKRRDQKILGNLRPRLEALIGGNKTLTSRREGRPLEVMVFYGTVHRSLLDAVLHKNDQKPAEGFAASLHPGSYVNAISEGLYAHYLRGNELPEEAIVDHYSHTLIGSRLLTHGHMPDDSSALQLDERAHELLNGGTFADARQIAIELASAKL